MQTFQIASKCKYCVSTVQLASKCKYCVSTVQLARLLNCLLTLTPSYTGHTESNKGKYCH
jgi:hypothetical protein